MMPFDPRFLIGPSEMIMGLLMAAIAYQLWVKHPVAKVLKLAPFVTTEGIRVLLEIRIKFFAFGAVLIAGGLNRTFYWFGHHNMYDPWVKLFGSAEALLAVWGAVLAVKLAIRLWVKN